MVNILQKIITDKAEEVALKKQKQSLKFLMGKIRDSRHQNFFMKRIISPYAGDISLIAEIKLKSPTAGILGKKSEIFKRAKEYEEARADCLSVITDKKYFGGEIAFIKKLKTKINLPVLQKDFVIDPYQIFEGKAYRADAILLIAKILKTNQLKSFVSLAKEIGFVPVVEIYDEDDFKKAIESKAEVIGVNARSLENFTINLDQACELGRKIDKDKIFIGFSGIKTREEVEKYKQAGAKAVLVGTSLMKSNNVKNYINHLKGL